MSTTDLSPITADARETDDLRELAKHLATDATAGKVILTDSEGHEFSVPDSVLRLLPGLVAELSRGSTVAVVPIDAQLTTQQAADILGVSRPYFIKLLDSKDLPHVKVGTHRRVKFSELLEYKQFRDRARLQALQQMTAEAEEEGLPY